jgi:hypothetical protein
VTEHSLHPDDELVELALGDVGEPSRSRLVQHLVTCARCRAEYEELVDVVDAVLPAASPMAPPVGFEERVLRAMDAVPEAPAPVAPLRPRREVRTRLLVAAAAAIVAAVVGGAVAVTVWDDDGAEPTRLASDTSPLRTSDGEVVGFAALSYLHDRPALIVSVSGQGARGVGYHCRILYADGHSVWKKEPWALDDPGGSTWIESAPTGRIVGMELVTEDGQVWATAPLT